MTTINNMSKIDSISLQFAGRDYINLVGGENKFKKNYIEKVIKDEQAAKRTRLLFKVVRTLCGPLPFF
ncbi:MAG: hypothetical protein LBC25_01705 [Holosporales bacterium]|jgi:hypothetical protein|nr:hypothetical protein [Holosporales bacterium]